MILGKFKWKTVNILSEYIIRALQLNALSRNYVRRVQVDQHHLGNSRFIAIGQVCLRNAIADLLLDSLAVSKKLTEKRELDPETVSICTKRWRFCWILIILLKNKENEKQRTSW